MNDRDRQQIIDGLPAEVRVVLEIERLKEELRQNPVGTSARKETVSDHSWHIAACIPLLAAYAPEPIDIAKAVLLAVVHDMAEAYVGDVFAYGDNLTGKQEREHAAMADLQARHDTPGVRELVGLWREYEERRTPEARFAKAMDVFLPILLNYINVTNSSWLEHGVKADQVRQRLEPVRHTLGRLAALNDAMIDQAEEDGFLK